MNLNDKILSVIVPVYNVEQYISACLDSLYNQGVDENLYEIIIVNDGTSDNSMYFVDKYAVNHTNITIINQKNEGVSAARNNGMKYSKGQYIAFLDSDDEIFPNVFNKLINVLVSNTPDVLVMRSIKYCMKNVLKECYGWTHYFLSLEYATGLEVFSKGYTRASVCGCVYSRDFLLQNQIQFPLGIKNGEDAIFYCLCDLYSQKTQFFNIKFYMIKERINSASTTYSERRLLETKTALDYIKKLLLDVHFQNEIEQKRLYYRLYGFLSMLVYNTVCTQKIGYKFLKDDFQINKYLPIRFISSWKVQILNMSPYCFYLFSIIKNQVLAKWFRVL